LVWVAVQPILPDPLAKRPYRQSCIVFYYGSLGAPLRRVNIRNLSVQGELALSTCSFLTAS
jgi:hypothetical protein